jgi:pimeloyl-ACP methyl ester carboxylesterase
MHRRALLAAPPAAALLAFAPLRRAFAQGGTLTTEEFMIPARDAGLELFLRNKRPEGLTGFSPARTVLFVHGLTFPASTTFDLPLGGLSWMDYVAGRGFDVWCLDLRGYGRSSRPPEMAQPAGANPPLVRTDAAVADVAAAAEFIRARRSLPRLSVMGWSYGTALMGRYATENPNLVERAVLYAPVGLRDGPAPSPMPTGAFRTTTQQAVRGMWPNGVPEAKRAGLLPPGWFEHFAGLTWATDSEGMRQNPPVLRVPNGPLADVLESYETRRMLYDPARIAAPTLLVVAEWDQITPPAMAQAIFPLMVNAPGKRLVVLGDGTHAIMLERNRGALFQAVQVFLEEAAA